MHFASVYDRLPEANIEFPSLPITPMPADVNLITAENDAFETFRKLEIQERVM